MLHTFAMPSTPRARTALRTAILKPANILVTKAGINLLDFGLAKLSRDSNGAGFAKPTDDATLTVASPVRRIISPRLKQNSHPTNRTVSIVRTATSQEGWVWAKQRKT
jgi:serine/threonine protein kinase